MSEPAREEGRPETGRQPGDEQARAPEVDEALREEARQLLARLGEELSHLRSPLATYRVQLHKGFTFDDAAAIAGYLADLGITDLYTSPILQAAPGSTHGYDVVDPDRVNSELGGEDGFRALVAAAHAAGLGILLMLGQKAVVLAEDLGTVPDFVRASLAETRIPGTKVLRWENDLGVPREVTKFSPVSCAVTGTHDTESLWDWWEALADW